MQSTPYINKLGKDCHIYVRVAMPTHVVFGRKRLHM